MIELQERKEKYEQFSKQQTDDRLFLFTHLNRPNRHLLTPIINHAAETEVQS